MPTIAGMPATGVWTIILLIYAFFASMLSVTTLLQPRDYINSHQLLVAMVLLVLGALVAGFLGKLKVVAPVVQVYPEAAPSMWPFLFITIACGAISGFHSLVSSGTSAKQVAKEDDALFVGYGSMVLEGMRAVLVIIAVAAGIGMAYQTKDAGILTGTAAWTAHYKSWTVAAGLGSKVNAVVEGSANMIAVIGIPKAFAIIIMGVFVASFAGTTLDTTVRIQRYVVQELASDVKLGIFKDKYVATGFAVITAAILAFNAGAAGAGALTLWPLFGATNQILAGLGLITITLYLKQKGGAGWIVSGIPAVFDVLHLKAIKEETSVSSFFLKRQMMLEKATLLAGKLVRVFWMMIGPALIFLASDVFLHRTGVRITPPGNLRYWGLTLLILSVTSGIALPILMRTLFHSRAVKTKKVEHGQYRRFQEHLIMLGLSACYFACLAYLFLVSKLYLYGSVFAGLYGVYSSIPSRAKLAGEMRYYGLEKEK